MRHAGWLALCLASLSGSTSAGPDAAAPRGLDAEVRKQVRSVARSVLVARRQASQSSEAQQVRAQIDQLRSRLEAMSGPIDRAPERASEASDLAALRRSLDSLDEKCRKLRAKRGTKPEQVATDASDAAVRRLERVHGEVETALRLPPADRRARLGALAQSLRIHTQATEPLRMPEPSQPPTFRNRTQHR